MRLYNLFRKLSNLFRRLSNLFRRLSPDSPVPEQLSVDPDDAEHRGEVHDQVLLKSGHHRRGGQQILQTAGSSAHRLESNHRRSHRSGCTDQDPTNFWESNMGPAQHSGVKY